MATILSPDVIQELGSEELKPKWEIKKSPISGRGLFATEPIKRGSIIMSNKPLVIGPRADIAGEAFCSNCYNICDSHQTCEKCSLLVCSKECEDSDGHAKECQFIVQNWKRKHNNENNSKILGQVLVYIRFLLLTQEQKEFLNVLQKTDHQCKNEELEMLCSNYVIPEEQLKFMKTTSSVLKINSFRISANTHEQKVTLRGLYPLSAFLNHSCMPNTRTVFKKDYSMSVYASKDIEIGEEILICYTGLLWCTPARRCQLYKTKQFWCKCARCQDLTEMGTKLSALKCMDKQCQGLLLPVTPLNPATEWNCDICSSVVSPERVSAIQSVLGSLVGTLDLDNQLQLDSIIVERLAIFIPYYNHIFVDISLRTALKIGYNRLKLNGTDTTHVFLNLLLNLTQSKRFLTNRILIVSATQHF